MTTISTLPASPRQDILSAVLPPILSSGGAAVPIPVRECTKAEFVQLRATLRRLCCLEGWDLPDCLSRGGGLAVIYQAVKELSIEHMPDEYIDRALHIANTPDGYRLVMFTEGIMYAEPQYFYYNSFTDTCSPAFVKLYRRFVASFIRNNGLFLAQDLPFVDAAKDELGDRLYFRRKHRKKDAYSSKEIRDNYKWIDRYEGSWGKTLRKLTEDEKKNPFNSSELTRFRPANDTEREMCDRMADALPALSPSIPLVDCSMGGSVNAIIQGEDENWLVDALTLVGLAYDAEDGFVDYVSSELEYKFNNSYYTTLNPIGIPAILSPRMDDIELEDSAYAAVDFISKL